MSAYDVVGLKQFSNELQMRLESLLIQEHSNQQPWTNKLQIIMLTVNDLIDNGLMDGFNKEYGEHSHYLFFNEHANRIIRDYSEPLKIIGRAEIDDSEIGNRYIRVIESVRFV